MDSPLNLDPESMSSTTQTDLPAPLKKFLQGEPLALGITQIFIGIIGISFGILLNVTDVYYLYYIDIVMMPYWSGILYIISGSLAAAAARNPKITLVQGALAVNVISAVIAGIGIIVLAHSPLYIKQYLDSRIIKGILAVSIVLTILELCINISLAYFGCKMLCRCACCETERFQRKKVVVVCQNATPANAEYPPIDCR